MLIEKCFFPRDCKWEKMDACVSQGKFSSQKMHAEIQTD